MSKDLDFISRWGHLFENLQVSSMDFYGSLERAIGTRLVPEMHSSRVDHKEGGLTSANRQYVRLHRGKYAFDICGAPFGSGFFVSWWLTVPPLRFGFLYTIAFFLGVFMCLSFLYSAGFAFGLGTSGLTAGAFGGFCLSGFGTPLLLWFVGNALRHGVIKGESTVLAIPLVGWIYELVFAPPTYYSIDSALMFQEAVHNAVLEVTDCMTTDKGVRALTELERKPIMKRFAAKV